ncbi:MAG: DUF1292 domain-containing protein [Oscillospiraceae bacterium]|jgi:uncharacterized protein YrzB (UPF0473 family)|nr:DUF1292 domain-containing protein [Oscillospiraceae bacterium]
MDNEENGFGADFIVITDEEGNEYEIEHLDTIELYGAEYMAFLPVAASEDENPEMVLFKVVEENGEQLFATIDDEEELQRVYAAFIEQWYEDGEYDADDDDEDEGGE